MSLARHVHLDPLGGIAGDMFIAAALDAFPELAAPAFAAMRAAGLPEGFRLEARPFDDHRLAGTRLVIEPPAEPPKPTSAVPAIRRRLEAAGLPANVRARALDMLRLLAEAEGAVHGMPPEAVHFHELAGWDSVADLAGAAFLIEALGAESWSVGPLPFGRGRVGTAHGPLPVPGPAAARLLAGFVMIDDGRPGERVTPTGAAILRHLMPTERLPSGGVRLGRQGYGFGTMRLEGMSNVLRLVAFDALAADAQGDRILVLAFEIDDQTAEDLAVGLARIAELPGVWDVSQAPVFGKKGRLVSRVQVLAEEHALDRLCQACFRETTTIGLRWHVESRRVLPRRVVRGPGDVPVKLAERPHALTAKAEMDALATAGDHHAHRQRLRHAAEDAALDGNDEDG